MLFKTFHIVLNIKMITTHSYSFNESITDMCNSTDAIASKERGRGRILAIGAFMFQICIFISVLYSNFIV